MMNEKGMQMFYVINSETKQIQSFGNRSAGDGRRRLRRRPLQSKFPYRKVAERYAKMANQNDYHDATNCYVVMSVDEYNERGYNQMTHKVRNLMTGEMVDESINTPWSCSVASESYWSM